MPKLAQEHPTSPPPAVIFAAKSTDEDNGSVETQLAQCETAATAEGREVHGSYEDRGQSGYSKNRGPELAKALAHAERLAAETGSCELWVQHSDRLSRGDGKQAKHLLHYALLGLEKNIVFRSLQDPQTFGDLLYTAVTGQRNHEDSHRKSMATRDGKKRRFEDGKALGAPVHDGYRLALLLDETGHPVMGKTGPVYQREFDPERTPIVERIFDLIESGMTPGEVARQLNSEGLRTRPMTGFPQGVAWGTRRIRSTVTNAYYSGWVVAYGERRKGDHPVLVEPERFERIQANMRRLDPATVQRRKGGRKPAAEYILRGVAFCARCGAPMYTRQQAIGRVYVCRNVRQAAGICTAERVVAEPLESAVLAHLDRLLPNLEDWIRERADERRGERAVYERAVEESRKSLRGLEREVELMRADYRSLIREGKESLARVALEESARADAERAALAVDLDNAATRLTEWDVRPSAVDAALDFYTEVSETIKGRVAKAESAVQLRAALADLLTGIWVRVEENGWVSAHIGIHTPDEDGRWYFGMDIAPDATIPRPPGWLPAESDLIPSYRTIPSPPGSPRRSFPRPAARARGPPAA